MKKPDLLRIVLAFLILSLSLSALGYFVYKNGQTNIRDNTASSSSPLSNSDLQNDLIVFIDPQNRFSIKYPRHSQVKSSADTLTLGYGDPTGENWNEAFGVTILIKKDTMDNYINNFPCEGKGSEVERNRDMYQTCMKIFEENRKEHIIDSVKGIRSVYGGYESESVIDLVEHDGYLFVFIHSSPMGLDEPIISTFRFAKVSSEGQSCGVLAGQDGNAKCANGLKCQYDNPNDPYDIGTCIKP